MGQAKRKEEANIIIKEVLDKKSFLNLTEEDKSLISDVYKDDIKKNFGNDIFDIADNNNLAVLSLASALSKNQEQWYKNDIKQLREISKYLRVDVFHDIEDLTIAEEHLASYPDLLKED